MKSMFTILLTLLTFSAQADLSPFVKMTVGEFSEKVPGEKSAPYKWPRVYVGEELKDNIVDKTWPSDYKYMLTRINDVSVQVIYKRCIEELEITFEECFQEMKCALPELLEDLGYDSEVKSMNLYNTDRLFGMFKSKPWIAAKWAFMSDEEKNRYGTLRATNFEYSEEKWSTLCEEE